MTEFPLNGQCGQPDGNALAIQLFTAYWSNPGSVADAAPWLFGQLKEPMTVEEMRALTETFAAMVASLLGIAGGFAEEWARDNPSASVPEAIQRLALVLARDTPLPTRPTNREERRRRRGRP